MAVVRPFLDGRLELGADGMVARGYTGQTTETLAPTWTFGQTPYVRAGIWFQQETTTTLTAGTQRNGSRNPHGVVGRRIGLLAIWNRKAIVCAVPRQNSIRPQIAHFTVTVTNTNCDCDSTVLG